MASIVNASICAGLAILLYFWIGLSVSARLMPRPIALMLAPGFGWAIHSALALPLFFALGMSRLTVFGAFAAAIGIAAIGLPMRRMLSEARETAISRILILSLIGAALLAFGVMAAVLPKISSGGVTLAAPIFDHSKVAIINEMTRLGVPPVNPYLAGTGAFLRLSYYYLWHFSAAELSLLTGSSGWEADAGLTWFTAFSSLATMIGLAIWLSGRQTSAVWVVVLAGTASIRLLLNALFGSNNVEQVAGDQSGFGGWTFQTSWAPQHMASATCAVLAAYLLVELARRPRIFTLLAFALVMAAMFESSTWIGGVLFPLAAAPITIAMLAGAQAQQRIRISLHIIGAVLLALLLISPFLYDQLQMTALRGGAPIEITPYEVLGDAITDRLGGIANIPAYWLIFLVVDFPAFYLTGIASLIYVLKDRELAVDQRPFVVAFAIMLSASLAAAGLLASTLAENNDLGWRAVLPAVLLLIIFSAVGLSRVIKRELSAVAVAALVTIMLGLPEGASIIYSNIVGRPAASSKAFAATPELWRAVRRIAATDERVANNPLFFAAMTPWPVNISWALLSNRRSCYAGPAFTPLTALSPSESDRLSSLFTRVFAGKPESRDVEEMAKLYRCDVAVITPDDGAWKNDPFANSLFYLLSENTKAWRIYKVAANVRK